MKPFTTSALSILLFLESAVSFVIPSPETALLLPPANLATTKFSSWLSAFNTGHEGTIVSFYNNSYTPANNTGACEASFKPQASQFMDYVVSIANGTGGFEIMEVESSTATTLTVLLQEKRKTCKVRYWEVNMVVDEEGNQVTQLDLYPVLTPLKMIPMTDSRRAVYEKGLQPLTPLLRGKVVEAIAKMLREEYVYPEEVEAIVELIETKLNSGSYGGITDSTEFSQRLSQDLRRSELPRSRHIFFSFSEPLPESNSQESMKMDNQRAQAFRDMGYGFANVSFDQTSIEGKVVATMKLDYLLPLHVPGMREGIAEKMNNVADADVLLLDIRDCFGISSETAAFILSYLFATPRPLIQTIDRLGMVQNTTWTLPFAQLPEGSKPFGGNKPIYVLVNDRTASEAEGIAYSLQAYGRAKIAGEHKTTLGEADLSLHPQSICDEEFGEGWWKVYFQNLKRVHVLTRESWEGSGVTSDFFLDNTGADRHDSENVKTDPLRDLVFSREKLRTSIPELTVARPWTLNEKTTWVAEEEL